MDDPTDLTKAQRQRADALVIASRILGKRPSPFGVAGVPEDRSTEDLVDLAQFILRGEHPLAAYREASLSPVLTGTLETVDLDPALVSLQDRVNVMVGRDAHGRLRPVEDVDLSTPGENPGDEGHGPSGE